MEKDDANAHLSHLENIWTHEHESPAFQPAIKRQELQLWHNGKLHCYHGEEAAKRLYLLAPTVFCSQEEHRGGAVGLYRTEGVLSYHLTAKSLARSYVGAGAAASSIKGLADYIVSRRFHPQADTKGKLKSQRFYRCVSKVHLFYNLMHERYNRLVYRKVATLLATSMLEEGKAQSKPVVQWTTAITSFMHGTPQNELEEFLCGLPIEERANLWRSRRLFTKDDNVPTDNAAAAIQRMVVSRTYTDEQTRAMNEILTQWENNVGMFVQNNREELRQLAAHVPLHRASATTFFSRAQGGGAAEAHFTVGLYRLSLGRSSTLQDVWGSVPDHLDIIDLVNSLRAHDDSRRELFAACDYFMKECTDRGISYPYLCIYPERETKSRTFMLLPYAIQLGGRIAGALLSHYLKSRSDTKEVFAGFNTSEFMQRIRSDIELGADTLLSLDSKVATDQLPHEVCLRLYRPFYDVMPPLARKSIEHIFAPTKVHVSSRRPKPFLGALAYEEYLSKGTGMRLLYKVVPTIHFQVTSGKPLAVHLSRVPTYVRTRALAHAVATELVGCDRVILTSPTGSGKTMLAATLFNSIIQFPSVASLQIFSLSLTEQGILHNVCWAQDKEFDKNIDGETGLPFSILCTSYYVETLHRKFPDMVVVLDEADSRQENYMWNVFWTRRERCRTLLMTATPEELQNEETTTVLTLEGGTNYPVETRSCTYDEMLTMLQNPEFGKSLICTYSEPSCDKIANALSQFVKVLSLTSSRRSQPYLTEMAEADVIVSTNVIRSSVTIEGLMHVFDMGLVYESVDFPVAGFEALQLFTVSKGMRTQLRGRVGRLGPGTAWSVSYNKVRSTEYESTMLCRMPKIASQLGKVALSDYCRKVCHASLVVERFSQLIAQEEGVRMTDGRPLYISIIHALADKGVASLCRIVAFECLGIPSRLRQLKEDDDLRGPLDKYLSLNKDSYFHFSLEFMAVLKKSKFFTNELSLIEMWVRNTDEDPEGILLETPANLYALSLVLWRQVAMIQGNVIVGLFRDFQCAIPSGFNFPNHTAVVAMGLTIQDTALQCRGLVALPSLVVERLSQRVQSTTEVYCEVQEEEMPILSVQSSQSSNGRQKRNITLRWDAYTSETIFAPSDLSRIWDALEGVIEDTQVGPSKVTTCGSPMSSTASFPVLNSVGLAVHDWVRQLTQESLRSASLFGDDDFIAGSRTACELDWFGREAVGLAVKPSDTGMLTVRNERGELMDAIEAPHLKKGFALFTERIIDPISLQEVRSIKPSGVVRLYAGTHGQDVISDDRVYITDMTDYAKQIERIDPHLHEMIVRAPDFQHLESARRVTAPRRILSDALRRSLGPHTRIATGSDVDDLFKHLESVLLLFYPSTKGSPDRILHPKAQVLGHPLIGLSDARRFAEQLQGDCFFSLNRPPLKFNTGPFAGEVAVMQLKHEGRIEEASLDIRNVFSLVGWGDHANDIIDPYQAVESDEKFVDVSSEDLL